MVAGSAALDVLQVPPWHGQEVELAHQSGNGKVSRFALFPTKLPEKKQGNRRHHIMGLIVLFLEDGLPGTRGGGWGKWIPSYPIDFGFLLLGSPEKRGSDGRRVIFLAEAKGKGSQMEIWDTGSIG